MSVAGWADVRDGVQAAIALASSLAPERVIWAGQNYNAPALDYLSLSFTSSRRLGQDYIEESYDAARQNGQQIAMVVKGVREVQLEVTAFTVATVPGASPLASGIPGTDALGLLDAVSTSLILPSVRDLMTRVGITPFDPGPVQNVPAVVSAGFRGRGSLPIRCYAPAQAMLEYATWIQTVAGTITTTPPTQVWPYSTG